MHLLLALPAHADVHATGCDAGDNEAYVAKRHVYRAGVTIGYYKANGLFDRACNLGAIDSC